MRQILLFIALLLSICAFSKSNNPHFRSDIIPSDLWEGDIDLFTIEPSGDIEFISPEGVAGSSSIAIPISYGENMTWELDILLDFKPTNSNNMRLYIYSSEEMNMYIQVGNNNGQISLYKQEGYKASVLCISGRKKILSDEPYPSVSVRLTLEDNEIWTLYTRVGKESTYYKEGSFKQALEDIPANNKFTLTCRYVKSRISEFFINNLKITNKITEPSGPELETPSDVQLSDIELLNDYELQFIFDKPVDISKAICTIEGIGNAIKISYDRNKSIVNVRFNESLEKENEYYITWDNLYDMEGNPIIDLSVEIYFEDDEGAVPPVESESGDILINEIMADPKGSEGLPETEYVELYNTSGVSITLKEWIFVYDGKEVLLDNIIIPSKGYVVIYKDGRDIHIDDPGIAMPLTKFPSALANNGKFLQLKDATGKIIDEISYPKAKPGVSWERLGDVLYNSTDVRGGTPGSVNSESENPQNPQEPGALDVEPGEIIFNELLPNPYPEASEYIELYNRSKRSLSLKGLAIATRKADGSLSKSYSLSEVSVPLDENSYVLLTKHKEEVIPFYFISIPESLYDVNLPVLANTSATLVLFRENDEVVIDEITYSSKWHTSSVKDQKGVALERIDPEGLTQDADNWTSAASTAGYGTPGYQNSQFLKGNEGNTNSVEAPKLNSDGLYEIVYLLNSPGYSCRASIYNISGYRVAEIANHELLGMSGNLIWDGNALNGNRLRTGVYVFYMELYNINGETKKFKKVFTVR